MNPYLIELLEIQRRLKYLTYQTRKNLPQSYPEEYGLLNAIDILLKRAWLVADAEINNAQKIDTEKTEEPKIIPPHARLRKPRKGAIDYASVWHTESEHLSHGEDAYRKTHER